MKKITVLSIILWGCMSAFAQNTDFKNRTITADASHLAKMIETENITVSNNSKLTLNCQYWTKIFGPFNINEGSQLVINTHARFPVIRNFPFVVTKIYGQDVPQELHADLIFNTSTGKAEGMCFCNQYFAYFNLYSDDQITNTGLETTYKFCGEHPDMMYLEYLFLMAMQTVNNYEIDDLNIRFYVDDTEALEFTADMDYVLGALQRRLTLLPNGNVGIGTSAPYEKLTVKGDILASEVEIKTLTNIPDYVFKPGYELMPLEEVEAFVKQNSHLPEIPSEKEFLERGMTVGEMNLLLLKKVEELTLYVISHQKELNNIKEIVTERK